MTGVSNSQSRVVLHHVDDESSDLEDGVTGYGDAAEMARLSEPRA